MEQYIAQMMLFAGNFAPRQWALCEGQLIAIGSNTALFSLLGVTYGGGGRNDFKLPDMRGRVAIHKGTGAGLPTYGLGQYGGVDDVVLNVLQIPSHTHIANTNTAVSTVVGVYAANVEGSGRGIAGGSLAKTPAGETIYSTAQAPDTALHASTATAESTATSITEIGRTGNGLAHTNMQPFQAINYIIALEGIYPSRS